MDADRLINISNNLICSIDYNGKFLFTNPCFCEHVGYTAQELQGKKFLDFIFPDDLPNTKKDFEKLKNQEKVPSSEIRNIDRNGICKYAMWDAYVVPEENAIYTIGKDITETKNLEDQLRISNQLLESTQSITKVGGWELNLETGNLYWTKETYRILEVSPDTYNPTLDAGVAVFTPDSQRKITDALQRAREFGEGYDLQLECHTKKGNHLFVRTTCEVTCKNGEPVKLTGIFQDVTEARQLGIEKQDLLRQCQLAIETAKLGVWSLDLATDKLVWNPQLLDIYGLTQEEFSEDLEAWRALILPEDFEYADQELNKIFNGESVQNVEFRIKTKAGKIKYIEATGRPIFNEAGEIVKAIGINRDITETIKSREAVIATSEKFAQVFDNMPLPTAIVDFQSGNYLEVNNAFFLKFGFTRKQLFNNRFFEHNLAIQEKDYTKIAKKAAKEGHLSSVPIQLKAKSDEIRDIVLDGRKLYENNQYIFIISHRDITEELQNKQILDIALEKKSEADKKYKLLFNSLALGVGYYSSEGVILSLNNIAYKEMGGTLEDFIGKSIFEIFPKEDADEYHRRIQYAIHENEHKSYEDYIKLPNANKWFISTFSKVISSKGEILGVQIVSQNITKLKEIQHRNEQLSKAVEQSPESIVITNTDGTIEYVNPAFTKVTGYSSQEALGKRPSILQSGFHPEAFFTNMWQTISTGETWQGEIRNKKKNSELYWENVSISPLKDSMGRITHFVGIKEDISEYKKLLEELQAAKIKAEDSENFLHNIIKTIADPVFVKNAQSKLILVNQSYTKLFKVTAKQVLGNANPDTIDQLLQKRFLALDQQVLATGQKMSSEDSVRILNGEKRVLATRMTRYTDQIGEQFIVGTIHDLTSFRDYENQIKESNERFHRFSAAASEGILIDVSGIILDTNDRLLVMLGRPKDEVIGRSISEFIHPEDLPLVSKMMESEQAKSFETRLVQAYNHVTYVEIRTAKVHYDGQEARVSAIYDITEVKNYRSHLEELVTERTTALEAQTKELIIAEIEMEEAYKKEKELGELKSKFVSTASHQFRTPLTVIQSNIELMEMNLHQLDDTLRSRFMKSFERITKESYRMTALMDDVLILGKINANALAASRQWIDIIKVSTDLVNNLNLLPNDSSTIDLKIINKPKKVYLDENQLIHILLNVLSNAQKYSLNENHIVFQIIFQKDHVKISIKDQGIGMSSDDVKNIFQPFTRGRNTEGIQGTGLGMSIVQEYVALNDGEITIESDLNVGTNVELIFSYKTE